MDEGGFKNGASLCRGPGGRAPLLGTLGYERKALGMGISLHGGSGGQPGMGSSTGDFERWVNEALDLGHLSV